MNQSSERAFRILIVEDYESYARMLRRLLTLEGFEVDTAATLQEAALRTLACPPDLILSDLTLPDGDGEELLTFLAAQGVPAIALTGHGAPADVRRSRAAGFVAHLVKPVEETELLNTIDRVLNGSQVPAPGSA